MGYFVVFLICVSVLFTLTSTINLDEKSHDVWLVNMEKLELNPNWLTNMSYKLKKINKYDKALNLNVTLLQDIDSDDVMCQGRIFQKLSGQYVKAPLYILELPCCKLMKNSHIFWPCIRESTNLPNECPITKGIIQMEDFNPNVCEYSKKLRPNQPEEYKGEFIGTIKSVQIWKCVLNVILKKRMGII